MPKYTRKEKKSDFFKRQQVPREDSDSESESCSSELLSVDEPDVDETTQQEAFEEKLSEALDGLTQKSAQGRTNCFLAVNTGFSKKYVPDYAFDRRMTISDAIERGLRKGSGAEQAAAAQLASGLCIQLGACDISDEVGKYFKPILLTKANDASVSPIARAKCCEALGLTTFVCGGEMGDVMLVMDQLEQIFSGSYLKGDGQTPNVSAEIASLHASALSAWALLFTIMNPRDVYDMMNGNQKFKPSIVQLSELLMSPHLEVRMAAGEALTLVYEVGRNGDGDFGDEYIDDLVDTLKQLATDSHKYRAKKDRKQQRATFRDILQYIENDSFSEIQIKFGQETLVLDTWTKQKQYESLCRILASGMNRHLAENDLLREIFDMGRKVLITDAIALKESKIIRNHYNAAAFKARTVSRAKNRDKRTDF